MVNFPSAEDLRKARQGEDKVAEFLSNLAERIVLWNAAGEAGVTYFGAKNLWCDLSYSEKTAVYQTLKDKGITLVDHHTHCSMFWG